MMFNKKIIIKLISSFYFPKREKLLAWMLGLKNEGVIFGDNIFINEPSKFESGKFVLLNSNLKVYGKGHLNIGDFVYISPEVTIITSSHKKENMEEFNSKVEIGKLCWIGAGVKILPGVKIGEGAIIGAGSIVTRNIPSYSIAFGNPAKLVGERTIDFPYRLPGGDFYLDSNYRIIKNKEKTV